MIKLRTPNTSREKRSGLPLFNAALFFSTVFLATSCLAEADPEGSTVVAYPAPDSEEPFPDYTIEANGQEVFCYAAKVYDTRFPEGNLIEGSEITYSTVGFGSFDISGRVKVSIQVNREISSATIRPLSREIEATVTENTIEFFVDKPGPLTIEPDGNQARVLHLFVNPLETEKPDPDSEEVIYFGPGEHVVNTIKLESNQTLYVDGGAVVYFDAFGDDPVYREEVRNRGTLPLKRYDHGIEGIGAKNIKIKGRGILDFNRIITKQGRKNPIHLNKCEDIEIEGVIIRGANSWNTTLYRCKGAVVENLKELSAGYNSDGINLVLSQDVHIKNCFLRQRDDSIVMKSMDTGNMDCFIEEVAQEPTTTSNVLVEDCVIWSDWGYALGVTYEIRMPVHDITFRNCDIIHATHASPKQGVIGILVADSSTASAVRFENITIERALKPLIMLDQRITPWTVNEDLGSIYDVEFSGISYLEGERRPVIFRGFEGDSGIHDINLNGLEFLGTRIKEKSNWDFQFNEHVTDVLIEGDRSD